MVQDVAAKTEAMKTAAKFFSEDKERAFEAKVFHRCLISAHISRVLIVSDLDD